MGEKTFTGTRLIPDLFIFYATFAAALISSFRTVLIVCAEAFSIEPESNCCCGSYSIRSLFV